MVDRNHKLSLVKQCRVLEISRSGIYYKAKPESEKNLELMLEIDKLHINRPFMGIRRMTDELNDQGNVVVNHKRIGRLMR